MVEIEKGSPLYEKVQGLIVSSMQQNSRAWQAGFRPGDVIFAVNRRRVRTYAELLAVLKASERGFAISLLRGDFTLTILVR